MPRKQKTPKRWRDQIRALRKRGFYLEQHGKTIALTEMVTSKGPKPYPIHHHIVTLAYSDHLLKDKCQLEDMAKDLMDYIDRETR